MPSCCSLRGWIPRGILLLCASSGCVIGCRPSAPPPIIDLGGIPEVEFADLDLEVSVEPQADDRRLVDIWVRTSHPALWNSLPLDTTGPEWEGLIVVLPKDEADARSTEPAASGPPLGGLPGEYEIVDGQLRFRLTKPLVAGEAYRVEFHRSVISAGDSADTSTRVPIVLWHVVPERTRPTADQ